MIAALVSIDLHIPAASSLKAKRGVLKSVQAGLRRELNVSVVETDHQNLWQRAGLGVAIAAGSETGARKVAQQVEKLVARDPRIELIGVAIDVVTPDPP